MAEGVVATGRIQPRGWTARPPWPFPDGGKLFYVPRAYKLRASRKEVQGTAVYQACHFCVRAVLLPEAADSQKT